MAFESCPGEAPGSGTRADRETACRVVEGLVAAALGARLGEVRAGSRGRAPIALARQAAMYLAHVKLGLSLTSVGEYFGRDRTTVAYACARIEDSRDDPLREQVFTCLEAAIDLWQQGFRGVGAGR